MRPHPHCACGCGFESPQECDPEIVADWPHRRVLQLYPLLAQQDPPDWCVAEAMRSSAWAGKRWVSARARAPDVVDEEAKRLFRGSPPRSDNRRVCRENAPADARRPSWVMRAARQMRRVQPLGRGARRRPPAGRRIEHHTYTPRERRTCVGLGHPLRSTAAGDTMRDTSQHCFAVTLCLAGPALAWSDHVTARQEALKRWPLH